MEKRVIYLDNHATTPMDERVFGEMTPYFMEHFGNASSRQHAFGWKAEAAVELARKRVASLLKAGEKEIVFTSGATESNNLAIKGIAEQLLKKGNHIITAETEHKAVLDVCKNLGNFGFDVTVLKTDSGGEISLDELRSAITEKTILVSLMAANNEIGTIHPLKEIGEICRERGVIFHTDATQAIGRLPIDVSALKIDLLSLTGHKFYGPKGCGALYIREGIVLKNQQEGGGQEGGFRAGTLNVPGIVGVGKAAEVAEKEMAHEGSFLKELRDSFFKKLQSELGEMVEINGVDFLKRPEKRLPNNLNVSFKNVRAATLMMNMKDIAVSAGSACSSGQGAPSHVLKAIGLTNERALSAIRFGFGRFSTRDDADFAVGRVVEEVRKLRG
jgi:cysteine desulfurase